MIEYLLAHDLVIFVKLIKLDFRKTKNDVIFSRWGVRLTSVDFNS